ncbi:hypothetical protein [uncultured Lacinutrix sp.]|uniref:hypothetical protein n=1 Tax=uncultured Lacinutrix sp. TaxID=574032 RepID=UPI00262D842A|nr:hypothetical protein [uncultured Lacinutrix sp.]
MRPLQYKSQYINLRVDISQRMSTETAISDSNTHMVSIHSYLSGISNSTEKNRIAGLMRRNGYSRSDAVALSKAFHGKANIRQCQRAVAAIIDLQAYNNNLQNYCDTYLGLDCSGFINCYFKDTHGLSERTISSYYQRGRRRLRTHFEDFRSKDVLIWCDNHGTINSGGGRAQHIAVIDRVRELCAENMEAVVVESTGTVGLVHSTYTFFRTRTPGVYRVHRPLKPTTNNHVKIVPVV